MGFTVKIGDIELSNKYITKVDFASDTPDNSEARATDQGLDLKIWGHMLFASGIGDDPLVKLADWSKLRSKEKDSYRNVELNVLAEGGKTIRKIILPEAFPMGYSENHTIDEGEGTFYLHVRQKKQVNDLLDYSGAF